MAQVVSLAQAVSTFPFQVLCCCSSSILEMAVVQPMQVGFNVHFDAVYYDGSVFSCFWGNMGKKTNILISNGNTVSSEHVDYSTLPRPANFTVELGEWWYSHDDSRRRRDRDIIVTVRETKKNFDRNEFIRLGHTLRSFYDIQKAQIVKFGILCYCQFSWSEDKDKGRSLLKLDLTEVYGEVQLGKAARSNHLHISVIFDTEISRDDPLITDLFMKYDRRVRRIFYSRVICDSFGELDVRRNGAFFHDLKAVHDRGVKYRNRALHSSFLC